MSMRNSLTPTGIEPATFRSVAQHVDTGGIGKTGFHDLTLIKMIIARFMGTGCFLVRYSVLQNKDTSN